MTRMNLRISHFALAHPQALGFPEHGQEGQRLALTK
jgi:hypothetical protein